MDFYDFQTDNSLQELFACRACLATDIKLFDIHECDLAETFEAVMGYSVPPDDGLPQHLCHYCFALMQKYALFRERCKRSHEVLQTSVLMNQPITTDYLRIIDRDVERLSLPLVLQPTGMIDYEIYEDIEIVPDNMKYLPSTSVIPGKQSQLETVKQEEIIYEEPMDQEEYDTVLEHDYLLAVGDVENEKVNSKEINVKIEQTEDPTNAVKRDSNKKIYLVTDHPNIEIVTLTKEQQIAEIEERKNSVNFMSSLHKCCKCNKGFPTAVTYRNHMTYHTSAAGDVVCDICDLHFATAAKLAIHVANVHECKFVCKLCHHLTGSSNRALDHQKWHEGQTYDCHYCDESFKSSSACMMHIRKSHPSNYICNLCDQRFMTRREYSEHCNMKHQLSSTETWLFCQECEMDFQGLDAFNKHAETSSRHTDDGGNYYHSCPICGESFEAEDCLKKHEIVHVHTPSKCPECSEEFGSHEELAQHCIDIHLDQDDSTEPRFLCEICGRKMTSNIKLLIHRNMHTADKPFICPFCKKAFKFPQYLQIHVRIHTGERPYVCNICSAAFQAKANLNRHYKVHTGDKPYTCDLCGKCFTQSNSMKVHVKTVHLKMPDPYKHRRKLYRHRSKQATVKISDDDVSQN